MLIKKRIFLITTLLYILYTIFPLFADTFNIPVWLPSTAVVTIMAVLYPKAFANRTFYWFLAYALVLTIYVIIGKPLTIGIGTVQDSKKLFIEFAFILPTISIFSILCYLDDISLTRKLMIWSVLMLFVSFIIVVPLMLRYNSLREALYENGEEAYVPGLPSYSLMHAYTLVLPVFCYAIKTFNGWKKWISLIGLLVLCFVIYDTFVTTSLIIIMVTLIFTLFYTDKNTIVFWIILSCFGTALYFLYKLGFFFPFIDWIMPAFEGTPVEGKLLDFRESMQQGRLTGGNIIGRQNLHSISWNSFFDNPIFGTSIVGEHSVLIDRFGGMGIVAGIPFLMIFISYIKRVVTFYKTKRAKSFFIMGIIAGFIYLYQKGMWGCESWLMYMVFMPMGILSIERKTQFNGTTIS